MKLNPECVRDVLLAIESTEYGNHLRFDKFCKTLTKYTEEEISYTCLKLYEGNLIELVLRPATKQTMPRIIWIKDITYSGHEFLANIRSSPVWNAMKGTLARMGSFSLELIKDTAAQVAAELITTHLKGQL